MSSLMWDTFEWSGGECPFIYEYKRVQNDWHLETEALFMHDSASYMTMWKLRTSKAAAGGFEHVSACLEQQQLNENMRMMPINI